MRYQDPKNKEFYGVFKNEERRLRTYVKPMDKLCTFLFLNYLINILLTDHDFTKTIKRIAIKFEKNLFYIMSSQINILKAVNYKIPVT